MKVHEVMTTAVVTTKPDVSLKDSALALAQNRTLAMPAVDDGGAVVGVLSEADILRRRPRRKRAAGVHALAARSDRP